jgi:hypothetical protein
MPVGWNSDSGFTVGADLDPNRHKHNAFGNNKFSAAHGRKVRRYESNQRSAQRNYDQQMTNARKIIDEEIRLGIRKPYSSTPQDEKRIQKAGGANFSEEDMNIAHKWCLSFDLYRQETGMPPRHYNDEEIQIIQDKNFALTQSNMKTDWYGGYQPMLRYIKIGKEFEACFKDGKLDMSESAWVLSKYTEMSSQTAKILLTEYSAESLEDLHDMFFRCIIPQLEVTEMKQTKEIEDRKTISLYETYAVYFCLCTLGAAFFYFKNKAKDLKDGNSNVKVYDKMFIEHFVCEGTAEQKSDENSSNQA